MATYVGKVGGYDSYWSYCIHMDMFLKANDLVFFFFFFNFFIYTETTSDNLVFIVAPVQ